MKRYRSNLLLIGAAVVSLATPAVGLAGAQSTAYRIVVYTGTDSGAGTDADVEMVLVGERGEECNVGEITRKISGDALENGDVETFTYQCPKSIGRIKAVGISTDDGEAWQLRKVEVWGDGLADPKPRGWAVTVDFQNTWMPENRIDKFSDWWVNEGRNEASASAVMADSFSDRHTAQVAWVNCNDSGREQPFATRPKVTFSRFKDDQWSVQNMDRSLATAEATVSGGGAWADFSVTVGGELENQFTEGQVKTRGESVTEEWDVSPYTVAPNSVLFVTTNVTVAADFFQWEVGGKTAWQRKAEFASVGSTTFPSEHSASKKVSAARWNELKEALALTKSRSEIDQIDRCITRIGAR